MSLTKTSFSYTLRSRRILFTVQLPIQLPQLPSQFLLLLPDLPPSAYHCLITLLKEE